MKKINLIGIEFVVLLVLILIPFVSCADSGVAAGGQQNLCGDGFCEPTETATSCPIDCQGVSQGQPSLSTKSQMANATNTSSVNQPPGVQNNTYNNSSVNQPAGQNNPSINQPASTGNLPTQNSFFASPAFKIILVIIILIVLGIIAYLVLRNKNKSSPAVSNQPIASP